MQGQQFNLTSPTNLPFPANQQAFNMLGQNQLIGHPSALNLPGLLPLQAHNATQ